MSTVGETKVFFLIAVPVVYRWKVLSAGSRRGSKSRYVLLYW